MGSILTIALTIDEWEKMKGNRVRYNNKKIREWKGLLYEKIEKYKEG